MKLCVSCLEELFDEDIICPKCNGDIFIYNEELQQIKTVLKKASKNEQAKLLLNPKYMCVNKYVLQKRQTDEHCPTVLSYSIDKGTNVNPSFPTAKAPTAPTITCPYCKSTNCKKILALSKAGSVFMWGIFALGKTTKQWHCNNCGSEF